MCSVSGRLKRTCGYLAISSDLGNEEKNIADGGAVGGAGALRDSRSDEIDVAGNAMEFWHAGADEPKSREVCQKTPLPQDFLSMVPRFP